MSIVFHKKNSGSLVIFSFEGKILSESDLISANEALATNTNWKIVFDLGLLSHTNSSGIAFLVKTMTRARVNKGDVVLINPNEGLNRLFEITKMHEVFTILESLEAAVNYFKN
jgi:anti-sigma B factor antagonist